MSQRKGVYAPAQDRFCEHIAIDGKVISHGECFSQLPVRVISGPPSASDSSGTLPVFEWSKSAFQHLPHYGMPDRWAFDWVRIVFPKAPQ